MNFSVWNILNKGHEIRNEVLNIFLFICDRCRALAIEFRIIRIYDKIICERVGFAVKVFENSALFKNIFCINIAFAENLSTVSRLEREDRRNRSKLL